MNTIMYITYSVLMLWIYTMSFNAYGAPTGDSGTVEKKLDGQYLINLGSTYNNPLLKLLGKTFVQMEKDLAKEKENFLELCKFHPCGEWTAWTDCPVEWENQFSMINRTRTCGQNTTMCTYNGQQSYVTSESKVCEGFCPTDYNFTDGFCLKLFTAKLQKSEAQLDCQNRSGHVVNINTKEKSEALHAILSSYNFKGNIWLDGERKDIASPWEYVYGGVPDFNNWQNNEPSNGGSELCKIDEAARKWYDRSCTDKYGYVCEIRPLEELN